MHETKLLIICKIDAQETNCMQLKQNVYWNIHKKQHPTATSKLFERLKKCKIGFWKKKNEKIIFAAS